MKSLMALALVAISNAFSGPSIHETARVKLTTTGFKITVDWDHAARAEKYEICHNCEFENNVLVKGEAVVAEDTCGGKNNRCHVVEMENRGKATFAVEEKFDEQN